MRNIKKKKTIGANGTCSNRKNVLTQTLNGKKLPKELIQAGRYFAKEVRNVSGKIVNSGDGLKKYISKKANETKRIFTTIKPLGNDIIDAGNGVLKVIGKSAKILNEKFKCAKKELASTTACDEYQKEISRILKILGHSKALVTDMSTIGDFLDIFGSKKIRDEQVKKISNKLELTVHSESRLVDVAKKMHTFRGNKI